MTAAPNSAAMTTEELFRRHAAFVSRFLARLGVPAEHIPDALQEVFLVVHRQGGYRPGLAKPTSYLAGVALHAARKHRRRQQVDRARRSETSADRLPNTAADPIRSLQVQQDLERLQRGLDHLSEEHRTALVLVEIEGESCLSVAAALGVPVGTIYSRVHVARKKLQSALRWVDGQRPVSSKGRRLERAPSLSMVAWFGLDALFRRSEAARLLRVARAHPPAFEVSDASLAQHRELVQGGAELPSWAAHCVPHSATWFGVLSLGSVVTLATLTAAGVTAAVMLGGAKPKLGAAQRLPAAVALTTLQPLAAADAPPEAHVEAARPAVTDLPAESAATATEGSLHPRSKRNARRIGANRSGTAGPPSKNASDSQIAALTTAPPTTTTSEASAARSAMDTASGTARTRAAQAESRADAVEPAADRARAREADPQPAAHARADAAMTRAGDAPTPDALQPTAAAPIRLPAPLPADYRPVDVLQEMRDVASAEHLLASDPARALQLARAVREHFPEGYLREERAYVEVIALEKLGRRDEARAQADAFLRRYADGPYSQRVRSAEQGAAH